MEGFSEQQESQDQKQERLSHEMTRNFDVLKRFVGVSLVSFMLSSAATRDFLKTETGKEFLSHLVPRTTETVQSPEKGSWEERISQHIQKQVGSDVLQKLERGPSQDMAERMHSLRVEEGQLDLQDHKVLHIVEHQLPHSFLANIKQIERKEEAVPMPDAYGSLEGDQMAAYADPGRQELVFLNASRGAKPWNLGDMMKHEACHLSDAENNGMLTSAKRLMFYTQVLDRVRAPDRFHSDYVEGIHNKDPKVELQLKAAEYWADTCSAYFSGEMMVPKADRELVESVIAAMEPGLNFDHLQYGIQLGAAQLAQLQEDPAFISAE